MSHATMETKKHQKRKKMEAFSVHLFGLVTSMKFYKAKALLKHVQNKCPMLIMQLLAEPLVESEWEEFVDLQKRKLRGEVWAFNDNIMVFVNKEYLGGSESLHYWCKHELMICIPRYKDSLYAASVREMKSHMRDREHPFVYLDISIASLRIGSLVFELFTHLVPKTCRNFITLCTSQKTENDEECSLSYKDSPIHRIVPGGWIQGGDVCYGNGDNGQSIYGKTFEDENYSVCHNRRGIIGMANSGPHTNSSQFYVALGPAEWMNFKFVAFGQLVFGYKILQVLEELDTFNERPVKPTVISDSGIFDVDCMTLIDCAKEDRLIYVPKHGKTPDVPICISIPGYEMPNSSE